MSWTPNPNAMLGNVTLVTVAIPDSLHARLEQACDAIGKAMPEGDDRNPEDIIAIIGLLAAENLIHSGRAGQLFAKRGEHDDRP